MSNALEETERLNKLVENVLTVNQLSNKNISFHKEDFNCSELIELTVKRYFSNFVINKTLKLYLCKLLYF